MLLLLQHHLLQDMKIPAQTPPGCWVCLWWEIEEKFSLLPQGSFGSLLWLFSPWLSSCAQVLCKKISPGQFQVSGDFSCTKLLQLQWDPAWLPTLPFDSGS